MHFALDASYLALHCTSLQRCKQAHAMLIRLHRIADNILASRLIAFLVKGNIKYAQKILASLPSPDSFVLNAILRGHARGETPHEAFKFLKQVRPRANHHTFTFLFTAAARASAGRSGEGVHGLVVKSGMEGDLFVLNSMMRMYLSCGWFGEAHKVFDGSPVRDVVSWNVMIGGYVAAGWFSEAMGLFEEMRRENERPDGVTLLSLMSACSRLSDLETGRSIHSYADQLGLVEGNLSLRNAILDMYCKCGDLESARNVFSGMNERDLVTWTTMVSGLASSGCFQEALELFGHMQYEGVRPDEVILVTILSVCAHVGALDQGKYAHLLIDRYGVNRDVVIETALVDMYGKCGCPEFSLQVFEKMREKNVFTWNALICGLAMHGHGNHALKIFERMRNEQIAPDEVTFIGLLSACSHAGLVHEGFKIFRLMRDVYSIRPKMEHYGCMIDILCRAKLVQDALAFIESMTIRPNAVMWASIIGACRAAGNVELAEQVGERIIELEPDTCDRYVLLSNLYAGARRWDNALTVRNMMQEKGIKKVPGISWIEVNGIVQEFVAGDRSPSETKQIYMMVEEICHRVKAAGHVSSTEEVLFNIEEEEKEHSLFLHSEKLAIAFGLLNSSPGSTIRITKNLRVCSDCHSFLKAVSAVFEREIVARDRSRFHHFKEGICSCKDFW